MRESRASFSMPDVAEGWRKRISELREYAVVRDGNLFRAGLERSPVYQNEYAGALELRERLARTCDGIPFESLFQGTTEDTPFGEAYCIEGQTHIPIPAFPMERVMEKLLSNLKLVRGIGASMERKLKSRGYRTIHDLLHHPRYRRSATSVLESVTGMMAGELESLTRCRLPRTDPLVFQTSFLLEPERLIFLDIETLGLFTRPVILLGIGRLRHGHIHLLQYLLRDPAEEPAMLWSLKQRLEEDCIAFVTYNGRTFDIPYISERFTYYGIPWSIRCPHYDLLHFSRRAWGSICGDFRLTSLEKKLLDIERNEDLPSQLVPEFYEFYLRTGNCGPLIPIVRHNREDLCSLVRLYGRLAEACA